MKYDVTIGIPVFMTEDYIANSLASALSQSYPSVEFLIVDDGGNDHSVDVVCALQKNHQRGKDIRIIHHAKNLGVSVSRNQIIDEAKGEYLFFMDSDDVITANAIELLMKNIQEYDAEIAFGSYEKLELSGMREVYQYPPLQFIGEDLLASFAYRQYAGIQASVCNFLVKTSLLRDKGLRFIETNYWEDFAFTFDLVTFISRAVLLPNITYTYLCRENSLSHYQVRDQISKDEILRNVHTIDHLKKTSSLLYNKVYYPNRCFTIVMTDVYMACYVLKRRKEIFPSFSYREINAMLTHPASFKQICAFRQVRKKNLALFILGKMPPSLSVFFIWCIGKIKKMI